MSAGRRTIVVAMSKERVIGLFGRIPWHYRGDLVRFKRLTIGHTVIMGRHTWESLPKRPLAGRRNLVVTRRALPDVECFRTLEQALAASTGEVFFIGGAAIYQAAMAVADVIDVTWVPDYVDSPEAVRFPPIDLNVWSPGPILVHEDEPRLHRQELTRRS